MAVPIVFGSINVNNQNTDAVISVGTNSLPNWDSHQKRNFGIGVSPGINFFANFINYVIDPDVLDSLISDPDIVPTAQNQQL
jgi:hypothetical protein